MEAKTPQSTQHIISPPIPVLKRLSNYVRIWMIKIIVATALFLSRTLRPAQFKVCAPTYTKRYHVRPMLENRVFIPKSWQPGKKLPLYLDIHGGGFVLSDPQTDDEFCHQFAERCEICVVSINYRKAPECPFPGPVHDVAEVAKAVLADNDLPIDLSKIAAGGFSAGGNLALAIAQLDGLRGRIRGVFAIYPPVDLSHTFRGPYIKTKDGKPDILEKYADLFDAAYISPGQDLCDPLLSPIYASRDMLPKYIFFCPAEYDVLFQETEIMAKKLAGIQSNGIADAEREAWEKCGIKWKKIPGVQHGWTHQPTTGPEEVERKKMLDEMSSEAAKWLKSEVYS